MKALISGYYGQGNAGDEALLMSLLQMLPSKIEPIVISAAPQKTQQKYNVKTCPRLNVFSLLAALKESDIFIWGGGSLIQDTTSLASPIYYLGLMKLAQMKGLKTIAWGQGIGPLHYKFTRWITKKTLAKCTAISVRDRKSAKLLSEWDIHHSIAPDPVWALRSKDISDFIQTSQPIVAINLRNHPSLTIKKLKTLTNALVDFQKITNTYILLVPFQASQDFTIAHHISKKLSKSHEIIQIDDPQRMKGLFKNTNMTIGMRLHCLIMAASERSRCFALSYDPKVKYLMEEINIPGWELDQLPDDSDMIKDAWLKCYFTSAKPLNSSIQSLKERAMLHKKLLEQVAS